MERGKYNEIVQHWIHQVLENRGKNAEISLKCCNDLIQYGVNNGDNNLLGFGYYYRGETYYCLNDSSNFFESLSQALFYLNKAHEWELMAECYNFLGIWATNRGNAPVALDYYVTGLTYCQKYKLEELEAVLNINVGSLDLACHRYREAQTYLEKARDYVEANHNSLNYHSYMLSIMGNLIKDLTLQEHTGQVEDMIRQIYREHWNCTGESEHLPVLFAEALYYHRTGNIEKRDATMAIVSSRLTENLPILDMFEDFRSYAEMLLEADKDKEFWEIMDALEPMVRNCNILNMHRQIIALKIRCYRQKGLNAEYLQSAGLYYELSEMMEKENQEMVNNVLNLRHSLDSANRARYEAEQQNRILVEKSEMDPLTKIANRFKLNDYSDEIYAQACRMDEDIAVEILDVDYFKEFNDNYGHQAGDNCLVAVSSALKSMALDFNAFCARYGGDEFVIIYNNVTKDQAVEYAAELKRRVLAMNMLHEYSKAIKQVTVSQGLCWGKADKSRRMWDFLHTADTMLYNVKKVTRNNYCLGTLETGEEPIVGAMD